MKTILSIMFFHFLTGCNFEVTKSEVTDNKDYHLKTAVTPKKMQKTLRSSMSCDDIVRSNVVLRLLQANEQDQVKSCKYSTDTGEKLFLGQATSIGYEEKCAHDSHVMVRDNSNEILELEERIQLRNEFGSRNVEFPDQPQLMNNLPNTYQIPVVVHVIHKDGEAYGVGSNISDEQIHSSIEALNNHFRKIPGTDGDGDGVDVNIEFQLALRDPNNNATNGINRVSGSAIANYDEYGIESVGQMGADETAIKNLSKWDQNSYVNIWVVADIGGPQSSVQGYAYFPTQNTNDGIVMAHNAMGTMGTVSFFLNKGTTLTHEMGHYFSLYHTFHNSPDCIEVNCETDGDKICDTPVTTQSPSCTNLGCIENTTPQNPHLYMDYTSESCKNAFTQGQKDRMQDSLINERSGLLNSMGLVPVSESDVAILEITTPASTVCSANNTLDFLLANYGTSVLNSVYISVNINEVEINQQLNGLNIPPGSTQLVSYGELTIPEGSNLLEVTVSQPNGLTDENNSNNSLSREVLHGANTQILNLSVNLDFFGSENSWELKQSEQIVSSGGGYPNNSQGTIFEEQICVAVGCYQFKMKDSYGDGQSFSQGSYELKNSSGEVLASGSQNWGYEANHNFCLEAIVEEEEEEEVSCYVQSDILNFLAVYGCTNCESEFDIDGNNQVDVSDLLFVLSNQCF